MKKSYTFLLLFGWLLPFTTLAQNEVVKDTVEAQQVIELPTISLSSSDLEEGETGGDNISGLLFSSRDVYVSTAGFQFGSARYRVRGYESEYTNVSINGIPMNDMESGGAFWSTWGGLNDVTRTQVYTNGIGYSDDGFGNIGGLTNITTRASGYSPGSRVTYSSTNRNYRNRLMATYSSGLMHNGWAFTMSASRRWAQEGYVEGTFYDAYSYFLAVEKRINEKHSLNLTAFGAPRKYGRGSASTQEAYDLVGSNFYNPNWGYQDGEKRNSRISDYHKPFFALTHYWDINENAKLTSSVSYSFGKGASTALNWYTGDDPRPDYYKNLPSYWVKTNNNPEEYQNVYNQWVTNPAKSQLNWERLYYMNGNNQESIQNVNGIDGNTVSGKRAINIVEERRNDHSQLGFNTIYKQSVSESLSFNLGLNASIYKGYHFKVINDLLGADFWLDVNKYNERENNAVPGQLVADIAQNDLNHPNRIVRVGDRFDYDFVANVNKFEGFGQVLYKIEKFELLGGLRLTQTAFWRTGNYKNGAHPDNSYGDGEKHKYFDFAAKAGITYKITGRHFLQLNGSYQTEAPYFRNAYYSSRTRDGIIDGLTQQKIMSADASYIIKLPRLNGRFTGFYSTTTDETIVRNIYFESTASAGTPNSSADETNGYGSYIWKGVDSKRYGLELGMQANLTSTIELTFAGGIGNYIYTNRPQIYTVDDNDEEENFRGTAYLKNYKIGGYPQTAASLGLQYVSPNYWRVGFNVNYFDQIYIDLSPEKHIDEMLAGYTPTHPQWDMILEQEKLDADYTVDFFAGYSWKIKHYYLGINLNVNNVLNNTNMAFGGYENYRFDPTKPDRFDPRYNYLYGIQYFLNLSLRF